MPKEDLPNLSLSENILSQPVIPLGDISKNQYTKPFDDNYYTQSEYDKIFEQYQLWKNYAQSLEENIFAMADMIYHLLTYINAQQLSQQQSPIMINDIERLIDKDALLTTIAADLRKSGIESGIGIISEMEAFQNYLKTNVIEKWQKQLTEKDRENLSRIFLSLQK